MNENAASEGKPAGPRECRICLGEHDEEIHAASLNVREWFRGQVVRNFEEEVPHEACVA
jgi:hypothetical protein